jgi:hypothetical protein
MTAYLSLWRALSGALLVVVTLAGCLSGKQTGSGGTSLMLSSDGGSGGVARSTAQSVGALSGSSGGARSLGYTGPTTCQISSAVGTIEAGIRINPNSPCLIPRIIERGNRSGGSAFGNGTGGWTPPEPSISCASSNGYRVRAGFSTQVILRFQDLNFASTGLFITARGNSDVTQNLGNYVAAISADGAVIDYSAAASLPGVFEVFFTASAGGVSGSCRVLVDNEPEVAPPTPEPRAAPQLACGMGNEVPNLSANGEVAVRFEVSQGQLVPSDVVGFRIRDDVSGANLAADPGVIVPEDAAFGATGTSLTVTVAGPRRIPFEKNGRLYAVVNGVEQLSGCPVRLVASQCVGVTCGPIPNNACGAGIDNYIVSGVDPTTPIPITTDLDPQGISTQLALLSGNFDVTKASLLNVGIGAYEFKLLSAADLPTQESKLRLTFASAGMQRSCEILVPKKDALGNSGNGTGEGGTYQGIVGNVYRTPVNAPRLMRPMELPNPFRDNLLWSNFGRNNWAWTNGLPGVSSQNDSENLKEWMQVNFGGIPLAFARYRGYDLNHLVRTEITIPYEGELVLRSESDDGVLVFVDQPGPENIPLTSEGLPDVAALEALSVNEIRTAVVNNDGLHALRTRDGRLLVGAARFASQCNGVGGLVYTGSGANQRLVHQCLPGAGIYPFRLYYYQGPRYYIGNLLKWAYLRIVVNDRLVGCETPEAQALMTATGVRVPCGLDAFGPQNSSNAVIPSWAFKSYKGSAVVPPTVEF